MRETEDLKLGIGNNFIAIVFILNSRILRVALNYSGKG